MPVQSVKINKNLFKLVSIKDLTGGRSSRISMRELDSASTYIGHLLGESVADIKNILTNADSSKIQLLKLLARMYSMRNSELPAAKREGKKELFQLYNDIKKPLPAHFDILRRAQDDFGKIRTVFSLAQDERTLQFVSNMQRDILRKEANRANIVIDILNSKHKSDYMDNIEQFKSYLKLNSNNSKAMEKLDLSIDKKRYDRKKYDSKVAINQLMQFKTVRDYAQPCEKLLTKHYTPDKGRFLWRLTNNFLPVGIKNNGDVNKDFLDLYKSTNSKNVDMRLAVLDNFKYFPRDNAMSELSELKKLFKKVEKNEEIKSFVSKSLERGLAVNSVGELNKVIDNVKLKKANYFFENLRRIVALSDGNERKAALNSQLENPFFNPTQKRTTRVWKVRDNYADYGFFAKLQNYINNKIKIFIYDRFISKHTSVNENTANTPLKITKPAKDMKIQIRKEVNDIIKTKLGKNVYKEQEDNFRLKATKIRLSLLPDMFDSIKASRAQSRAEGLVPLVSNRDASSLYELINGANRKTVRYMLNQTDKDGKRIFNIREIIRLIEDSNKKINTAKQSKPDYRAADTKAYYENVYNDFVSRYGKLKRAAKQKPKAA